MSLFESSGNSGCSCNSLDAGAKRRDRGIGTHGTILEAEPIRSALRRSGRIQCGHWTTRRIWVLIHASQYFAQDGSHSFSLITRLYQKVQSLHSSSLTRPLQYVERVIEYICKLLMALYNCTPRSTRVSPFLRPAAGHVRELETTAVLHIAAKLAL